MKRTYTVILRSEPEGGFTAVVPALRGCVTYGEDLPEALRMAQEAIECCVLGMQDMGETPPVEGQGRPRLDGSSRN
jgi:predicted RNase H-like HicB family nuclease